MTTTRPPTATATMAMTSLWSKDKEEENLSDWTLAINGENYYVHRIALAPIVKRGCDYFRPLFFSPKVWNESETSTSSIEFPPGAAAKMDKFLDYVYTGKTDVGMQDIIPLRFLASYFGCSSFFESYSHKTATLPVTVQEIMEHYELSTEYQDEGYFLLLSRQLTKCLSTRSFDFPNNYDDGAYDGLFSEGSVLDVLLESRPPKEDEGETILYYASVRRILVDIINDPSNRKTLFRVMTSGKRLEKLKEPFVALRLMYEESLLTEDALGNSISNLQRRCMEVLDKESDMEFFLQEETQRVSKRILGRRHSPELEAGGFFEVISSIMMSSNKKAKCEDDDRRKNQNKRRRITRKLDDDGSCNDSEGNHGEDQDSSGDEDDDGDEDEDEDAKEDLHSSGDEEGDDEKEVLSSSDEEDSDSSDSDLLDLSVDDSSGKECEW